MGERTVVLVFPCGSEMASEIHDALRYSVHARLVGASGRDDHGRFKFDTYVGGLPRIDESGFEEAFTKLVRDEDVALIFPTHDSVVEKLARMSELPEMGATVVNGDPRTASMCRSKRATYAHFVGRPWIPSVQTRLSDVTEWPVVVKPNQGQGGQGVVVAHDAAAAAIALSAVSEPVVTEFLPGAEATVDCFTDRFGRLLVSAARSRERVTGGISMRSTHLEDAEELTRIASEINASLKLRGPWFFQVKRDRHQNWKLLEVSARLAGAAVTQRARGLNLPLMTLLDYREVDLVAEAATEITMVDRRLLSRAELNVPFDTVYLDLDDTLIDGDRAIPVTVSFLYQMIAADKRVVLLTRHDGDVEAALAQARLSPDAFDEIVHLVNRESKADYVTPGSIFVDNHFPERAEVRRRHGIPVLDVDALQFLIR